MLKQKLSFMITRNTLAVILLTSLASCSNQTAPAMRDIDWQGHRGARGLLPENTIPAFLKALEFPQVRTLEMDVVVSKDLQVVVSHDPWMEAEICLQPDGSEIPEPDYEQFNLYELTYDEIKQFDCGSKAHPRFPEQEKMAVHKPLLTEVVEAVESQARTLGRALPYYNIEIKALPILDDRYTPAPAPFARLVLEVVTQLGIAGRTTLQSFDPRILEELRNLEAPVRLSFLVENEDGLEANLARLDFTPDIYSPEHLQVDAALVEAVHRHGMELVPWTVNDQARMLELVELGVDGVITDYPDRIPDLDESRK